MPLRLLHLRALERRLKPGHKSLVKIKEDITLREAGYRGELSFDYYLKFLDQNRFYLLNDLRLRSSDGYHFQMDTVVISEKFIAIIEIKNIAGRISFNESTNQMYRKINDNEQVLQNPLTQVRRQRAQLVDFLIKANWPLIPIVELVAISNPATFIESNSSFILPSEEISYKLEHLNKVYSKEVLKRSDLHEIVYFLHSSHVPEIPSSFSTNSIPLEDINKGVYCPQCSKPFMIRSGGRWYCRGCGNFSKEAHVQALEDYFLLIKSTITNKELRLYFRIDSRNAAYRILRNLTVSFTHKNKHSFYTLSYPLQKR